jgi:hypothetical protein
MTREGHDLLERALKLSPAERMKLAHEILAPLPVAPWSV